MDILIAVIFGIVEGITEWLPVSSTGHMIILNELIGFHQSDSFVNLFLVVLQLGAIMAVVVLFWNTLWPFEKGTVHGVTINRKKMELWGKILIACVPAAIAGVLFDSTFEKLFYHALPVAVALIVFGIAFIVIERRKQKATTVYSVEQISIQSALIIGGFQLIAAVFPGTSRSGATIVGALLIGISRTAAAEFTFCLAVPVMAGASLLKLLQYGLNFTGTELLILGVGMVTAFFVSLVTVRSLMNFIKKHDFQVFGWYRILLGGIVILLYGLGMIRV